MNDIKQRIREELLEVGFWSIDSEIEAAHLQQTVDALYSLVQEAVKAELGYFATLDPDVITGAIDHFVKCKVCLEPSHHCMCDQAVYAINRLAGERLHALSQTNLNNSTTDVKVSPGNLTSQAINDKGGESEG